jgi:hypothetical protein
MERAASGRGGERRQQAVDALGVHSSPCCAVRLSIGSAILALNATRTPRELAVQRATLERVALEQQR